MVFSSLLFLFFFLPVALGIFYGVSLLTRHHQVTCCWALTALSLAFYFWGSGAFVLLIVASILLNWWVGQQLARVRSRMLLLAAVALNLSALVYFKYARFLLDNLGLLGGWKFAPDFHPYLPVGVSFFTFMSIAYLVDVYRREQEPARLHDYATYLTLFPHLVAGPIVRYRELAQDLSALRRPGLGLFNAGILRFAQGLGMKVIVADNLAVTADKIFALEPAALTPGVAWLGALTYTFQIYFDFAGYSAMAIGLALMFGFHFPENFDQPYRAASITEFWRRWHMTLSRFLRDYVYIPLGGNRKGNLRTYVNLVLVFFLCGLWHGAAWTFVAWGLYQGALLIAERLLKDRWGLAPRGVAGIALTFLLTCFGWALFRSETLAGAGQFLATMLGWPPAATPGVMAPTLASFQDPLLVVLLVVAVVVSFTPADLLTRRPAGQGRVAFVAHALASLVLLAVGSAYAMSNSYKPFIYFRF